MFVFGIFQAAGDGCMFQKITASAHELHLLIMKPSKFERAHLAATMAAGLDKCCCIRNRHCCCVVVVLLFWAMMNLLILMLATVVLRVIVLTSPSD